MAGRSHAFAYRAATTVFDNRLPAVRLTAIADANEAFAVDAARRYGFARAEPSWEAIAQAPDIDAVSVVVGNALHREVVEGLMAGGKHVLCEKPLADNLTAAQAMVEVMRKTGLIGAVGYTFRRSPAVNAIREQIRPGSLGKPLHFNGHYWCDYGCDPRAPMSWRYQGGPGSGALADVGSHLVDLAEFLCGPVQAVSAAIFRTVVTERPLPLAAALGHAAAEVGFCDGIPSSATRGYRQVLVGPEHPYVDGGLPMAFPGVGHGNSELFTYQARAFLEQVAGLKGLPPCRSFADGLHTMRVLAGVASSAEERGRAVTVA